MNLKDTYRYLVGSYYGIQELDEYELKEYTLEAIEDYINDFINSNDLSDVDIEYEKNDVEKNVSLKAKLQDCLIVLPRINASTELILIVKARLKRIREDEIDNY